MLINDIFGKNKPYSFPQRLKVDGRVYLSTKLLADALNHSLLLQLRQISLLMAHLKLIMQI